MLRVYPNPAAGAGISITLPGDAGAAITCTTAGTAVVTSNALFGRLTGGDIFTVTGLGIPAATTLTTVTNPSSITLSAVCTAIGSDRRRFSLAGMTTVTNGTRTLTSAALFANVRPGMEISGAGIQAGTVVESVQSTSSLTMSLEATDSTSNSRVFSLVIECETTGSATLTSTAAFGSVFLGEKISGTGIADGTYVTAIASPSSLTMSQGATGIGAASRTFGSPMGGKNRIKSIHALFTASATAATRTHLLTIDDGANTIAVAGAPVGQTASRAVEFTFAPGLTMDAAATDVAGTSQRQYPIPDVSLPPGSRIITTTANIQAGDQWSAITVVTE